MSDPDEVDALRQAVLTAAFSPENLPERVAAAGVLAATPENSIARRSFLRWGAEASTSAAAEAAAELAHRAYRGMASWDTVQAVGTRYGPGGVVAAVGIAAAARLVDGVRQRWPASAAVGINPPPIGDEARPTLIRIRRSFDEVPPLWGLMAWEPRTLDRWWVFHEAALSPGSLTGEEKQLATFAVMGALGLHSMAGFYLPDGWSAREVAGVLETESAHLRRGVRSAMVSIADYTLGLLAPERFELEAADLPSGRIAELCDIVDFCVGLATYGQLKNVVAS